MAHYHTCPSCYENYMCNLPCTIEPDLSKDGKDFGSYAECDNCCRNRIAAETTGDFKYWFKQEGQKTFPNQEWWNYYVGIKK